jgi:hypothetical protein
MLNARTYSLVYKGTSLLRVLCLTVDCCFLDGDFSDKEITALTVRNTVLWCMTPCILVATCRTCCFYLQEIEAVVYTKRLQISFRLWRATSKKYSIILEIELNRSTWTRFTNFRFKNLRKKLQNKRHVKCFELCKEQLQNYITQNSFKSKPNPISYQNYDQ